MTPETYLTSLLPRVRDLLRLRRVQVACAVFGLTALVCAFIPLSDHLGFELAMVLTIVSSVLVPIVGAAAITQEQLRPEDHRAFGAAALSAAIVGVLGVAITTALILLNGLRRPTCEPLGGAIWIALLPIPTVLLAASVGAFARARSATRKGTVLRVVAIELTPLLLGLASIYWGPSFFLFDHFFGYFPGPLYDETVLFSSTVLIFRAITLGWAVVFILAASATGASNRNIRRTRAALSFLLALALLSLSALKGTSIGYWATDTSVAETLGGERRVDHLELHFPREWNDKTIDQLVRDAAFRASQVETALGIEPKQTVRVWMYRSAEEKRRLVGAAATSFAKPWRHEIHIHASGWPHPVIRHELVHAFGGEIAGGPFGVPGGLFPVTPLIEGFAVAMDQENDGMTLDQWAKAMRAARLAPDIPALLSATGFYAASPSRAYTYAGAFIRFLQSKFGRDKVLALYRTGDLTRLGNPQALVASFEQYLDSIPVGESERATAERRFSRPSVFRRNCAREVSLVEDEARTLMAQGRLTDAIARFESACSMEPDDPALLRNLLNVALKAKNSELRERVSAKLFEHPKLDSLLRASILTELGDDAWRAGQLDVARKRYEEAASLAVDPQTHRNAVARTAALENPKRAEVLKPLLIDASSDVGQLFRMREYVRTYSDDALTKYLLGRQLVQRDGQEQGISLLEEALNDELPDPEFSKETLRMLARAYAEEHECADVKDVRERMQAVGASGADVQLASDWLARCDFETSRGWSPL